ETGFPHYWLTSPLQFFSQSAVWRMYAPLLNFYNTHNHTPVQRTGGGGYIGCFEYPLSALPVAAPADQVGPHAGRKPEVPLPCVRASLYAGPQRTRPSAGGASGGLAAASRGTQLSQHRASARRASSVGRQMGQPVPSAGVSSRAGIYLLLFVGIVFTRDVMWDRA